MPPSVGGQAADGDVLRGREAASTRSPHTDRTPALMEAWNVGGHVPHPTTLQSHQSGLDKDFQLGNP